MKIDITEIDDEILLKWQKMVDDCKAKPSQHIHQNRISKYEMTDIQYNQLISYLEENGLGQIWRNKDTNNSSCNIFPKAWSFSFIAEKSKIQRGIYEDMALKQSQINANQATVKSAEIAKAALWISIGALIVAIFSWVCG